MKTLKITSVFCIIACTFLYSYHKQKNNKKIEDLQLENVEALAWQESSGSEEKKKYRYSTFPEEPCYIFVGGAYAKGKKVYCFDGTEHPVCVDCQL